MSLSPRQVLQTETGRQCSVERLLGGGGQGEVHQAQVDGQPFALKWYFPQQATPEQRGLLEDLVWRGAPTPKFLWPLELVADPQQRTFGYLMPLREPRFKGIVDMMKRRAEPSFRALCTAGYELADSYLQLHAKGLCYRDISFGNVFLDPDTGEVRICDNDNVAVTGTAAGGVLGTPRFMAPEIVRGEAQPSTETDLFSLAVLLFYVFALHHPLEGRRESEIHCFDLPAMNRLYGSDPLFIFDPDDDSNRPVLGYHDNAIIYWGVYPQFLRDLFTCAFTKGLRDPQNGRVRESEWRKAFVQLRDTLVYCGGCGAENFHDAERLRANQPQVCWSCNAALQLPARLRLGQSVVMLNHDTQLFPHHLGKLYDFSAPVAEMSPHPQNANVWGLKNLSADNWTVTRPDGAVTDVPPGRSVGLAAGLKVNLGGVEGEIRA
ncbi:MAG: serine/threonine protein kinase [Armatimonadetes bacterium CG_4_10_14_3_um_filter_66_18]|nr:MAG: serine/threonine protein kinase [Armatimonadetes bacterium CG06_land_8_20_14_3_00_66_21]PIX42346.1 MAG: serine/threonine protein kinase [Armatimonadetes bacterium CG_4_8_14_3_um_filter_66_20]PIY51226.1 MAG: serine/threonine protein kinase [Armatimonadetes bacterium CG_4_10_14_3_um_filter_66_18]